MNQIRRIFRDDCRRLIRNFFALVIVVGVCFLPALYAWLNIYSNHDPYGNTGSLKLAVVSEDRGYENDGQYQNMGESVTSNLKDNNSVDWQFVDTKQEAVSGVESGKYYAAVVIPEDFTYSIFNVFTEGAGMPTLDFYQNQKKNPVANKITDTVISTLQKNIDKSFVETVTTKVFEGAGEIYAEVSEEGGADAFTDRLKAVRDDLDKCTSTIGSVINSNKVLNNALKVAVTDAEYLEGAYTQGAESLDDTNVSIGETQLTLDAYGNTVDEVLDDVLLHLDNIEEALSDSAVTEDAAQLEQAANEVISDCDALTTDLQALASVSGNLSQEEKDAISQAAGALGAAGADGSLSQSINSQIKMVQNIESTMMAISRQLSSTSVADTFGEAQEKSLEAVQAVRSDVVRMQITMKNEIIPNMNNLLDSLEVLVANTSNTMRQISAVMGKMNIMFASLEVTIVDANDSLEKTGEAIASLSKRLSSMIDEIDRATGDEKVSALINALTGNAEGYGAFFAEPVSIVTHAEYPVENYGSSVAPFYTTLAIWVGAIILVSIVKAHPDKKLYPEATATQLFFGRYLTFFVLAQVQALIIVIGNIVVFKVQCLHPGWFWFSASVAATTFSLLIYALTATFGDIGKAATVVIVVLQIAGSSGTYPIELLPDFFKNVYIFFPFPYAINAMRECIGGMYESDYLVYLVTLCIFIAVALFIGLFLRVPFAGINHYTEERMEDTEMM